MPIDAENRHKIKDFLKANLGVLQGAELEEFLERYGVQEASMVQMMLLDFGMADQFIAVPHPLKPKTHCVISNEMAEKILFFEGSLGEKTIP